MARRIRAGESDPIHLVGVDFPIFRGEERITLNAATAPCNLPANANRFILVAEGAAVRYRINLNAGPASPGLVPENGIVDIVVGNMNTLSVYGAVGALANLLYFQQP